MNDRLVMLLISRSSLSSDGKVLLTELYPHVEEGYIPNDRNISVLLGWPLDRVKHTYEELEDRGVFVGVPLIGEHQVYGGCRLDLEVLAKEQGKTLSELKYKEFLGTLPKEVPTHHSDFSDIGELSTKDLFTYFSKLHRIVEKSEYCSKPKDFRQIQVLHKTYGSEMVYHMIGTLLWDRKFYAWGPPTIANLFEKRKLLYTDIQKSLTKKV